MQENYRLLHLFLSMRVGGAQHNTHAYEIKIFGPIKICQTSLKDFYFVGLYARVGTWKHNNNAY